MSAPENFRRHITIQELTTATHSDLKRSEIQNKEDCCYIGDGKTLCLRNPCETGDHNCHINAVCLVSNGSFECKCKSGFIGDGVDHCTSTTTMVIMKETNDLLDLFRAIWRLLQTLVLFSTDFINVLHK